MPAQPGCGWAGLESSDQMSLSLGQVPIELILSAAENSPRVGLSSAGRGAVFLTKVAFRSPWI